MEEGDTFIRCFRVETPIFGQRKSPFSDFHFRTPVAFDLGIRPHYRPKPRRRGSSLPTSCPLPSSPQQTVLGRGEAHPSSWGPIPVH